MKTSDVILWCVVSMAIGVVLSVAVFGTFIGNEMYKYGQLDYQRGIIKYELTESGYKEIHEVEK